MLRNARGIFPSCLGAATLTYPSALCLWSARTPHPEIAAQFPTSPKGEVEFRARREIASPWGEAENAIAFSGEGSAVAARAGKCVNLIALRARGVAAASLGALAFLFAACGARASDSSLPSPLEAGWKGEKVCEALFENQYIRAAKCTFPPGVGHERHYHPPHFGYIVEGGIMQITDKDGTREQPTPSGATWWSDGIDWHETVNIGDTTTVYVIVEPKEAAKQ